MTSGARGEAYRATERAPAPWPPGTAPTRPDHLMCDATRSQQLSGEAIFPGGD